jgi:hypothetical protein
MNSLVTTKASNIKNLNLKGIEITEVNSGNNDEHLKGLCLRDTITGTVLRIQLSPYSEIYLMAPRPVEFESKWVMTWEQDGVKSEKKFDSAQEAVDWKEQQNFPASVKTTTLETKVEKVD